MKGIWFDDVHSHEHLNLVLSKISIPPAAAKTTYVNIPGGDGSVDLTEALGEVKFKDRNCTFTFTVFPYEDFEEKKKYISNLLNGKRCKIILDKDPEYYWVGRCSINNYESDKNLHKLVVGATVAPYKLKTRLTEVTAPSGDLVSVTLENGRKTVIPTITTSAGAKITFEGNTFDVNAGTHTILNIALKFGKNSMLVTSNDTVTFKYREGDL